MPYDTPYDTHALKEAIRLRLFKASPYDIHALKETVCMRLRAPGASQATLILEQKKKNPKSGLKMEGK
jgi:hypothetical protein